MGCYYVNFNGYIEEKLDYIKELAEIFLFQTVGYTQTLNIKLSEYICTQVKPSKFKKCQKLTCSTSCPLITKNGIILLHKIFFF